MSEFVYWRQQGDGNNWVLVDPAPAHVVAWFSDTPDGIYDDPHGDRWVRDEVQS